MKIRIKKIVVSLMLLSLFNSYSMPLVSYASENPEEPSESVNTSIHDEVQKDEEKEVLESKESDSNQDSNDSDDNVNDEEYIENNNSPILPEDKEKVSETDEEVSNESSYKESEKKVDEKASEQVLEVRDSQYEAKISIEGYRLYSEPSNTEEANVIGTTDEYLDIIVSVKKEVDTDTTTWANIMLEDKELGWVDIEALEKKDQEKITTFSMAKAKMLSVSYSTHVQSIGWQDPVKDGALSGTEGQRKRLEAIKINIENMAGLSVEYSTHVQSNGWLDWVSSGELSGTTNQQKRLEAIKIKLSGEKANNFDIYYRVHAETLGWLDWAKNGEEAGTEGLSKRLEGIEIVLVEKGGKAPGATNTPFVEKQNIVVQNPSVTYQTHVEKIGWQKPVKDGALAGTEGQKKRIEAIKIDINNVDGLGVKYSGHVQSHGWMDWVANGEISGTIGQRKRLEAIKLQLTGPQAANFDVYYRVHSEHFGWLGWAKNGEVAGLEGYGFRAEAIEIKVLPKGDSSIDTSDASTYKYSSPSVNYSSHIQKNGWLSDVKNGQLSGTIGQGKRMEAIKIALNDLPFKGNITYKTHVQKDGWHSAVQNGQVSGTVGQQKRLEAIQINLTGDMAKYYDVYYRTHIQSHGWLGWAKNGMKSGSEGIAKRIEAIEIKLVKKNTGISVNEDAAFKKRDDKKVIYLDAGHGGYENGASYYGTSEDVLNLSVSKKIQSRLEKLGYTVIMSRITDKYISLIDRAKDANNKGADVFVSVHHNAMPRDSSVTGIETYYYEYDPDYQPQINKDMHNNPQRLKESAKLASGIQNALINNTGANNRGIKRNTFAVLRETKMPAVLLELGYMSSPVEIAKLKSVSYQNKLAEAVTEGVHKYFTN